MPQGIRLYTTSAPTQVSIEMKNSGPGSRQGAAFGVIFSQAVAKITVNGLASGDTSTTFRAGVSNNEVGSLESDSISRIRQRAVLYRSSLAQVYRKQFASTWKVIQVTGLSMT